MAKPNPIDVAFNKGCDARISGKPVEWSPYYEFDTDRLEYLAFRSGWRHAHRNWGRDTWRARPLPLVRETASA